MLIPGLPELAVALTLASVPAAVPYQNPGYGFALNAPRGLVLCIDGPPRPNHGAFLLLSAPGVCPKIVPWEALYVSISASYNALEYKTIRETAEKRCPKGATVAYDSKDLHFPDTPSASCRYTDRQGHARIDVFALRKERKDKRLGHAPDDWILFEASLVTAPERLAQDVVTFKATLAGIKFAPAP
ncbi:MAG TPA: hypothetical protein VKU84_01230 [Stellaceae bacterium]|nr:hypothetical protein [Stellaceae bacterium]